jgi:inositol 2-dehydrogenase
VKRIKIGVWGVGRIGSLHAKNVKNSEKAELVAVADPIERLAHLAARRFHVHSYDNPHEMLKNESLDGVVIATPTPLHVQHVDFACEAGIAALLEKPIALTMKEADRIVSTVRHSGVKFMIGFNRRSDPGYQNAKEKIAKGTIGKPLLVKTCARDPKPPPEEYIEQSGGIFVDECIHDFDVALWLMDAHVERVSAVGKTLVYSQFAKYGDYDNAVAVLEFRGGGLGIIEGSRVSTYGYDLRTEVLGSQGALRIDNWKNDSTELWTRHNPGGRGPYPWFLERFAEAYRREIDSFCDYVTKGGKSPASSEEGRAALEVAIAARESAKNERAVSILE